MRLTMKTLKLAVLTLLAFLVPSLALGATSLTGTTLSSALSDKAVTLVVASATGITVNTNTYNTVLYIDRELMTVIAVNGTTIKVIRGVGGSQANAHISGAVVIIAPAAGAIFDFDPQGSCTGVYAPLYTPWINQRTSAQWVCGLNGNWAPGFGNPGTTGIPVTQTATVTAATATAITGPVQILTGATTITSFTFPTTYPTGAPFCLVPDATPTISTGNNIGLGSTGVVGKTLCYTYLSSTAKYYPSY